MEFFLACGFFCLSAVTFSLAFFLQRRPSAHWLIASEAAAGAASIIVTVLVAATVSNFTAFAAGGLRAFAALQPMPATLALAAIGLSLLAAILLIRRARAHARAGIIAFPDLPGRPRQSDPSGRPSGGRRTALRKAA